MPQLRKGIFYEEKRRRYRVRVYKYSRVTHRSYHRTLGQAEAALDLALQQRRGVRPPQKRVATLSSLKNLLGGLIVRY